MSELDGITGGWPRPCGCRRDPRVFGHETCMITVAGTHYPCDGCGSCQCQCHRSHSDRARILPATAGGWTLEAAGLLAVAPARPWFMRGGRLSRGPHPPDIG